MDTFTIKKFKKQDSYKDFSAYVLGVDIGGTNTNIAIAGIHNQKPVLLFSLNFKSQEISSLESALDESLKYTKKTYNIDIKYGCIGAAGIVSKNNDFAELTNVPWNVDCQEIIRKAGLSDIFILNDFQIIGFGINLLNSSNREDVIEIKKPKTISENHLTKIIVGAGTGLGKSILIFDKNCDLYIPLPSEGGHADVPIYNDLEFEIIRYIKHKHRLSYPVTYEQVLSGPGLLNIYEYFKNSNGYKDASNISIKTPDDISRNRKQNEICQGTFEMFIRFYARCIKNLILDSMALGGVYIAGGIAMKNPDLFHSNIFEEEIQNTFQRQELLQNVPIYMINNYDLSLLGACFAAIYKNDFKIR